MNVCLFTCCIACDARGKTRTKGASLSKAVNSLNSSNVLKTEQMNAVSSFVLGNDVLAIHSQQKY